MAAPIPESRAASATHVVRGVPVLLAASSLTIGVLSTPFHHGGLALAYFALLYLGLFVGLWEVVRLLGRGGLVGSALGGGVLGLLLALQLRWDAEALNSKASLVAAVGATALVVVLLLRAAGFPSSERRRRCADQQRTPGCPGQRRAVRMASKRRAPLAPPQPPPARGARRLRALLRSHPGRARSTVELTAASGGAVGARRVGRRGSRRRRSGLAEHRHRIDG